MSEGSREAGFSGGMHHVTGIAGAPGANLRFYRDVLGLRLLKRTVNHDDPGTHHLYFGDGGGRPGSTLTFFPWPGAPRGRQGRAQAGRIVLAAPRGSLDYWRSRLAEHGVEVREGDAAGADRRPLWFEDPDGLALGVAEDEVTAPESDWEGPVPASRALRGVRSTALVSRRPEATASLLTELLGFREAGGEGRELRLTVAGDGDGVRPGRRVRILEGEGRPGGRMGVGTVHHVAWRVPDEERQDRVREELTERGLEVTRPVDRYYFRSVYFREPGGILFEVATEGPGFTRDEAAAELGSGLRLPPWLEDRRQEIEERLPAIPGVDAGIDEA